MNDFEEKFTKARALYDDQKFSEASKAYLSILEQAVDDKQKAIIWAELSWTFYQNKSYQQAIEATENVLNLDSDYKAKEDLFRIKGYSYLVLNELKFALESLNKSLTFDNSSAKQKYIHYELAKIYFSRQEYEQSERHIEAAEDFFRDNAYDFWLSAQFFKGFIKYYKKQIAESEQIFQTLLSEAKEANMLANANYGMAYIAFEKKDYLQTINLCEQVTKLNEHFYDMESLGFLMAASFFYLGRYDVFNMYFNQMQKAYSNGRYHSELKSLAEQIPEKKS